MSTRITRLAAFVFVLAVLVAVPAVADAQRGRGYGPPQYPASSFTAALRIDFSPSDADVYLDGRYVGRVADYDGIFQRLRVTPGAHQITIVRAGYRTERFRAFARRGETERFAGRLDRLPALDARGDPGGPVRADRNGFGTLSLFVSHRDADIWIDGRRHSPERGASRWALRLAPGRHRVEVRRAGMRPYAREIDIRPGTTFSLNITLRR